MENKKEAEPNNSTKAKPCTLHLMLFFSLVHSRVKLFWESQVGFVRFLDKRTMIALIAAEFDLEAIISLASTSHVSLLLRKAKSASLQRG